MIVRRLCFALALLLLPAASVAAEPGAADRSAPYHWSNVVVGAGGFAPNILFSRAERGLAYLRTDMGGAYRWDARAGRWIPLQDGNPVSSLMGIESIAPDPLDPERVYLAAGMNYRGEAAILRSSDRGTTWDVVPVPFKMGGNEEGRGLGERLAIDPNRTATLLFGSRHDGLQRSDDGGRTWRKVASFPHGGLGAPEQRRSHAGISFVLFDRSSGRPGGGSPVIYAGVADPGERHLFRSADGGRSWAAVPGGPGAAMLPVKGELDARGNLYVAYSTAIGPNGVAGGSVWKFDAGGRWTDITPDRSAAAEGGYMGLSLDAQRPGRLAVSSMNRWQRGDTVWLSEDDGRSWSSLQERSARDVSAAPFLRWGGEEAEFGHWIAGVGIDPFDGAKIAYTTGATVYRTGDGLRERLTWTPWVRGIEQTAVITLVSPTGGAPLVSGFGDIGGFVHERLDVSPVHMHTSPRMTNTNTLDFAGLAPNVIVRSGSLHAEQPQDVSLAWSRDGGRSWLPLKVPPIGIGGAPPRGFDLRGEAPIAVSADGSTFAVSTPRAMVSRDRGASWHAARGLPEGARIVADKADARRFYAVDFAGQRLFASGDRGRSFAPLAGSGLPAVFERTGRTGREAQVPLAATPGTPGELWFLTGKRLYRSSNGGASFSPASAAGLEVELFGLGRAAPNAASPALFATGSMDGQAGVWRSLDGGRRWSRINDDAHQWGLRFRAISGDPRRFGRVYLATDGRGIVFGDPR